MPNGAGMEIPKNTPQMWSPSHGFPYECLEDPQVAQGLEDVAAPIRGPVAAPGGVVAAQVLPLRLRRRPDELRPQLLDRPVDAFLRTRTMCVYMYACMHVYVCMYVCMHVCIFVCVYVCTCMYVYVCLCVRLSLSVCLSVSVCLYGGDVEGGGDVD